MTSRQASPYRRHLTILLEKFTAVPASVAKKILVPVLKKKWGSLRDCYRKALNRKKTVSGQKAVNAAPWKYEQQMSFLKAHVLQKRPQTSSLGDIGTQDKNPDSGVGTYDEETSGDITPHELHEEDAAALSDSVSIPPPTKRAARTSSSERRKCNTSASAHDIIKTYFSNKSSGRDHITAYFKMVEETVRTFSPLQQVEIKARISSLLTEYEYRNLSSPPSHHISPSPTFRL